LRSLRRSPQVARAIVFGALVTLKRAIGALAIGRLTPRCSGQHPGIRQGVAAELIRR
jgi:hypothetical protein